MQPVQSRRRDFLKSAPLAFPSIVPSSVFGQTAPSNRIQLGHIGCGRIARVHDIPETIRHTDLARYVAISDLDSIRLADGKELIESYYAKRLGSGSAARVKTYGNYQELLADKSVDAVLISTPDHWHAQPAIEAALAGKDVYLQKPTSLTIREGRQMAAAVKQTGRIFQLGSQQRSDAAFRLAAELVRNGRIGKIKEIYIGLPEDPAGQDEPEMPVPPNLNYDMWLGSTPKVYYTENRVHPQSPDIRKRYDRPGWLRCEQFGAGMITGWGVHHVDIAHWAMGVEESGPIEVLADAHFPRKGLWDVHGPYHVRLKYANGATVYMSEKYPNGLRFLGESGWIWVTRGRYNPQDVDANGHPRGHAIDASDPRILTAGFKPGEIRLHASPNNDHHLDWLTSIRTRQQPAAPAEAGHRSCSACLVSHIGMRLARPLQWDPAREEFIGDAEANSMLQRPQRAPYGTQYAKKPA